MAIVNMTAQKMYLASHSIKHQHGACMILQDEFVGGVRLAIQPIGETECYTRTLAHTHARTEEQAYYYTQKMDDIPSG